MSRPEILRRGIRPTLVLLVLLLSFANARESSSQTITGDVFGGLGLFKCCDGSTGAFSVGAGADLPVGRLVAINGEFGIVDSTGDGTIPTTSGRAIFGRVNVFSVDALVHFDAHRHGLTPFVKAGLDIIGAPGAAGASANVGGGFDWWTNERRGVRLELRDDMFREFGTTHVILVRAGFIFR